MKKVLPLLAAGVFPFFYYLHFVLPGPALRMISNDFQGLYWVYKAYLAESVNQGIFPFWTPLEVGGVSFFANPFAGAVYPLNLIPVVFHAVFGKYNAGHHQVFTILGVSIFCMGLYTWLRALKGRTLASLFASCLMCACWGISGFLRFPNAIHTIAWLPWALWALYLIYRRKKTWPGLVLCGSLVMMITAGYPYFAYYCLLFELFYAGVLYLGSARPRPLSPSLCAGGGLLMAGFMTAPYWTSVQALLSVYTDRAGTSFSFSTGHPFGAAHLLASLAFPPAATIEGMLYVGSAGLFIMLLYLWKHPARREKLVILGGILLIFSIAMGAQSAWFTPVWSWLPGMNRLRVFPRITILLMPLIAYMLHQGFVYLQDKKWQDSAKGLSVNCITSIIFGAIISAQLLLWYLPGGAGKEYSHYVLGAVYRHSTPQDFIFFSLFSLGAMLVLINTWGKLRSASGVLLLVFLLGISAWDAGMQGRYLWSYPNPVGFALSQASRTDKADPKQSKVSPAAPKTAGKPFKPKAVPAANSSERKIKAPINLPKPAHAPKSQPRNPTGKYQYLLNNYFKLARLAKERGLSALGLTYEPSPSLYYASYTSLLRKYGVRHPDIITLMTGTQKLYFHRDAPPDNPKEFMAQAEADRDLVLNQKIAAFSTNRLELDLEIGAPGRLTWLDNWDPGWNCIINGKTAPIEKGLGTFKSVALNKAGKNKIVFEYQPPIPWWAYAAMFLAFAMLTAWIMRELRRPGRNGPNA